MQFCLYRVPMMMLELFLTDSLTILSSETSSLVKSRGVLYGFSTYPSFYREPFLCLPWLELQVTYHTWQHLHGFSEYELWYFCMWIWFQSLNLLPCKSIVFSEILLIVFHNLTYLKIFNSASNTLSLYLSWFVHHTFIFFHIY